MAINPNLFSADSQNASDQTPDTVARKRRLGAILGQGGNLGDLFSSEDDTSALSKNALNEGDTSSPLATPNKGAQETGAPSALATENVPRAPVVNFTATPIATGQQQADAALSEAERGEVGQIGGTGGTPRMDTAARNQSLMRFFRPDQQGGNSADQQPAPTSQDQQPSDLSKASFAAGKAVGIGNKLRSLFADNHSPAFGTPMDSSFTSDVNSSTGRTTGEPGAPTAHQQGGIPATGTQETTDFNGMPLDTNTGMPSGNLGLQDYLTGAQAEMGPTGTSTSGGGANAGTAGGVAGGLLSLAGGLAGKKELGYAGQGVSLASNAYNAAEAGAEGAASGAAGGITTAGFGLAAGAANADASQYISERMGPIAGQITNTLANLASLAGPVGMAAGMFLSGIMGAIASGFSSPVYAEHRDEAIKSIQELLPVITQALPHVRTEQDFNELQHAVNALAQRWTLNSGGITGGYESGGAIGAKFNPLFTQALPMLESRGPAGPGEQNFSDWFNDYARNLASSDAVYEPATGSGEDLHPNGQVLSMGMGSRLAGVLGIPQGQLDAYIRSQRPELYDLIDPVKQMRARYGENYNPNEINSNTL